MENLQASHMQDMSADSSPTLLSPKLMYTHRFLVQTNARMLVSVADGAPSAAGSPAEFLAALRSSRRFQELVSTITQHKARVDDGRQSHTLTLVEARSRAAAEKFCDDVLVACVRRAFASLQQHALEQRREIQALVHSLALWRQTHLSRHLVHWHRFVVEHTFDAIASSFDKWLRYKNGKARIRVLQQSATFLTQATRSTPTTSSSTRKQIVVVGRRPGGTTTVL
jgi:hypothetical protein